MAAIGSTSAATSDRIQGERLEPRPAALRLDGLVA